ncbi:predicted protein [Postia placenta Mad-698-R]|uniref:Peptidylprolyl isomerase n=1 Tax=Postia placenta MAD-698-R-SB12 TaxID=670580 RepID=A0A1X6N3R1_9APHY|nr:hypothetical protein POSPLADRAFT_1045656 [Postia placenta MAD-698-R-SB12]EED85856.1 predicted protein [Postia placenta Mad-698-R]OSX63281.1 hypothetical protein POSPLADRAFT_1045656 [Postia placenta MAD-698-R-SB12]
MQFKLAAVLFALASLLGASSASVSRTPVKSRLKSLVGKNPPVTWVMCVLAEECDSRGPGRLNPEWQPILHISNQVVLYNPTSHALSIRTTPNTSLAPTTTEKGYVSQALKLVPTVRDLWSPAVLSAILFPPVPMSYTVDAVGAAAPELPVQSSLDLKENMSDDAHNSKQYLADCASRPVPRKRISTRRKIVVDYTAGTLSVTHVDRTRDALGAFKPRNAVERGAYGVEVVGRRLQEEKVLVGMKIVEKLLKQDRNAYVLFERDD